jgi:hypothetical protein
MQAVFQQPVEGGTGVDTLNPIPSYAAFSISLLYLP